MTTNPKTNSIRFAFFGTSHIATMVLDELEKASLVPTLLITMPPRKSGRGLQEKETDVAVWAKARNLPLAYDWREFEKSPSAYEWDVAIVVDYGKILPSSLLSVPKHGMLNVHPSLLPRYRGASPMRSAILNDEKDTGVSIIRMDAEMDHGPLVAQKKVSIEGWPARNSDVEKLLLPIGGALLAQILPEYVAGNIEPIEQNHDVATYCTKFTKEDGLIDFSDDPRPNLLKVRAFESWPGTYAFFERDGKKIRAGIIDAEIVNGKFTPTIVRPEGKTDMPYQHFLRSGAKPL